MFSSLSGIADKFSSFIREPVTPLGTSVHDAIYANSYKTPNYQKLADSVNMNSDPETQEEVWFVLGKALTSPKNDEIRLGLKIADYLVKNTGARFHNCCTPLYMRRMKEMIISKAKTGGADNMHLMNEARNIVRVWGEGFLPYASQGRGKVIVEGYQDMQRSGIRFPAPSGEETKWVPMISPPTRKPAEPSSNRSSIPSKRASDVDPKELYRNVKRLQAKLNEEGPSFFENEKARSIAEDCRSSQKALMVMIDREATHGDDETFLNRLLTLNDMCQQVNKLYTAYQEKKAAAKKNDGWSDDESPKKDDLWSDDEPKPRKPRPVADEPSVQVRSTRRRPVKQAEEAPKQQTNDDLLGLGMWDEPAAAPKARKPSADLFEESTPKKASNEDDWGFDEPTPRKPTKKVSAIDDLFEDEEEPAPRRPTKKSNVDDLFDEDPAPRRPTKKSNVDDLFDEEEPAPRRPTKKPSVDDLFDEEEPAPRTMQRKPSGDDWGFDEPKPTRRVPKSRQPTSDDWGFDEPTPARRVPKSRQPTVDDWGFDMAAPAAPAPVDPFSMMDFSTPAPAAPAAPTAPAPAPKPAKSGPKDVFEDLFSL